MKEDQSLQILHKASMIEFWKFVPESKYPNLKKAARRLLSIFGTCCRESWYFSMKFVKSEHRS